MKHRIAYHFYLLLLRLVALIPLRVLYVISDGLFLLLYHGIGYRRRTVADNLRLVFPEKSEEERSAIEKEFFRHLCDCMVETIKLLHLSDREIDRRVTVEGAELIEALAADGRSIIGYLGHYGNWEWMQAVTRHYRRPAHSGQIYRKLHSPSMDRVMLKIRSRFGAESILQEKTFRTLLSYKHQGKQMMVGFIADQRPNSDNLNHWTTFLGQDTAYSVGGEEIGRRIEAHYVYFDVEKRGRGRYHITFKELKPAKGDSAYPYTQAYLEMMEATIRRAPAYWLWSHKRWRFGRPERLKEVATPGSSPAKTPSDI